jgi:hypothetical protein
MISTKAKNILPQFATCHICEQAFFSCLTNAESEETNRLLSGGQILRVPSQKFGHEFSIRADAQVTHRTQTFHWL